MNQSSVSKTAGGCQIETHLRGIGLKLGVNTAKMRSNPKY